MALNRIVQECVDKCGRTRILKYTDGFVVQPWDSHAEEAAMEQARIAALAQEVVRRRLQLRNDLEAIKANNLAWWAQVFGV